MSPPPSAVRPDRKYPPKLVRPVNFSPARCCALKLFTLNARIFHSCGSMADYQELIEVDFGKDKDLALVRDSFSLVPKPLYARGARFLSRRKKGLVSTVLRMCQFKTNEYTQTTLLEGVELLRVTFYV